MKCKYFEECGINKAIFGRVGEGHRVCKTHREPNMFDLCNKMCEICKIVRATFGLEEGKPIACFPHKTSEMVDVANRKCKSKEVKCITRPSFGFEKDMKMLFCADHKKENMVDLTHKKCHCGTIASFGIKGGKPECCFPHKKEGMIDLVHPRCKFEGCGSISPGFGLPNGKPEFCSKHKDHKTMVDLVHRKCKHPEGCLTQPVFGFPNGKPEFCVKHKLEGMKDIVSKYCERVDCDTQPSFGFVYEGIVRCCANHAEEGMVDIKNAKCLFDGCIKNPSWGVENTKKRLYCAEHAPEDMTDVIRPKCLTENCPVRTNNITLLKYKGYCFKCFIETFPNEIIVRNYKVKEVSVVEFVKKRFDRILKYMRFNKKIVGGKSMKQPDICIRRKTKNIIVEVDEDDHIRYNKDCEGERLKCLSDDINGEKLIVIRFNPDGYTDDNGKRVKSCWGFNDKNKYIVKNEEEWNERLEKLAERINFWLCHVSTRIIKVENLFSSLK